MSRRFFAAGCWVLLALGLVHMLGHYMLATSTGETAEEKQLLSLMRGNAQDMGLGMVRSTFDLLLGFSLTFSILTAGMGVVGLVVLRHAGRSPGLLRQAAIVYAGLYGVMSAMALRYWFPAPLFFLVLAFLLFAAAVATNPREAR